MKKLLFFASLLIVTASCKKVLSAEENFDVRVQDVLKNQAAQLKTDDELIKNTLPIKIVCPSNPEGIYYVVEDAGLGTETPTLKSTVLTKYKGYRLDGTVFDQSTSGIQFGLTQVILGWGIGMQKFKRRSKGKLLIPSPFAYGTQGSGANIPANTPLIFDIELVDFQ